MTARSQWTVVGVIVLVLAIGLGVASHFMKDQLFPVEVGSKLPEFQAKDLATNKVKSLSDYKGKVLLLNVWATYCEPCKQEIPSLQSLYKAYGDSGLKLVAVSVDDAVSEDSIKAYARNFGITFDVLHDPSHEIERVLQTTGYPETFVVGPEGTIRKKWIGADNWSSQGNRALIAQLLGLQTPKPVAETGAGTN
ncbi:MAG TPA: TlpA disulfide reductase family protein [Gemmatimonadaceae bacterium]|jgi:cytochrome c-type biogenesis protein